MADKRDNKSSSKEPIFIVKPANKMFGLDYLHIALIALVIILVILAFALSSFKPATIIKSSNNSTTVSGNSTHTSAQALNAAEKELAAYSNINTSLSLIPFYSLVNQSKVSYLSNQKEWLVTVPYIDPLAKGKIFNISLVLYDSNLSLVNSYLQSLKPAIPTNNSVVGLGVVNLYGETACKTTKPIPIYIVTDPYAPGVLNTLSSGINASKMYGNSINVNYYFIFSGYSQQLYQGYGQQFTQQMGRYMYCASQQNNFPQFVSNLSIAYTGRPLTNITLTQVSEGSDLNITSLNGCLANATTELNIQSDFANLYHIVSTPDVIVNCRYSTLPQTLNYGINYSLSHLNG